MKLSVKALLPLAILLSGSVNCSEQLEQRERDALKSKVGHAMNFEESLVMALEHPSLLIKPEYESGPHSGVTPDKKLFNFEEWAHYLHNTDKADAVKAMKERISKDAAYKFYYLDLPTEDIAELKKYFDDDLTRTNLDGFENEELKAKIEEQFLIKKKYLETIMSNLPVIKDYMEADDDTSKIIKSHVDEFIANALMFDYKRFNFAGLHPVIEGIKGALEVPRKAKHGAEAAYKAIGDSNKDIVKKTKEAMQFTIKRKIPEDSKKKKPETDEERAIRIEDEKAKKEKALREINLINVALESANRSTSNPDVLFYTLNGSLLLMTILIAHNAITAKSADDEEGEGDEESGEAH